MNNLTKILTSIDNDVLTAIIMITLCLVAVLRVLWKIVKEREFIRRVMDNDNISEFTVGPKGSLHAKKEETKKDKKKK